MERYLLVHLVEITLHNSFRSQGDTKAQDTTEEEDQTSEAVLRKVGISVVALEEDIEEVTEEDQVADIDVAMTTD